MLKKSWGFLLPILLLTACGADQEISNLSSHKNLSSQEATQAGYVVAGPGGIANTNKLEGFYDDVQNNRISQVTIVRYTDEGDPIFVDLSYDEDSITYRHDNTWDAFGGQDKDVRTTACKTISKRDFRRDNEHGTEYYLTDCIDDIGYSDPANKEFLLLVIP